MTWRRAVGDAFRLLRTERWVATDLLAGAVLYAAWVAGTAALLRRAADAAGLSPPAAHRPVLVAAGLLWLAVPAAVAVYRLRDRLLNISGNVEQRYRFDRPAALLVPPAALLAVLAIVAAVVPDRRYGAAVLSIAGLYLLARTTAYSYRVFAFSRPAVLYAATVVTVAVQAAAALVTVAPVVDRGALVERAVVTLGAGEYVTATVGGVPLPLVAAVAVPVGLSAAYLALQGVAALAVRLIEPDVNRSDLRTGQRYPPFVDVADGPAYDRTPADGEAAGDDVPPSAEPTPDEGPDDGEDLDEVRHTRVFRPPGEGEDGPSAAGADLIEDGAGGANAGSGGSARRCTACGETARAEETVCPNCGTSL
ncbi:zinc ribbon domain-containing protein [Halomicrobium salinisoli]|uniref:zinc ribbon domain-containing protein n=1 Tax=Halomicrobium salinisoli TaxID=2878391 RepID=UPI001CF07CB9|nr:zinc ribbon domain-containing protein [Halomicrobium salinisoli]